MLLVDRIKDVLYEIKQNVKALQNDTYVFSSSWSNNSSSTVDVTLFSGPSIGVGQTYAFEVFGLFQTGVTTTGIRLAVNNLGTCTLGGYAKASVTDVNAATEVARMLSESSAFILTTSCTGVCQFELKFQIYNSGSTSFTPTIGFRSEVNASQATVMDRVMKYRKL